MIHGANVNVYDCIAPDGTTRRQLAATPDMAAQCAAAAFRCKPADVVVRYRITVKGKVTGPMNGPPMRLFARRLAKVRASA